MKFTTKFIEKRLREHHEMIRHEELELMRELVANGYIPKLEDNELVTTPERFFKKASR